MCAMLVDDDPVRSATIEASLRELGYEIVATTPTNVDLLAWSSAAINHPAGSLQPELG